MKRNDDLYESGDPYSSSGGTATLDADEARGDADPAAAEAEAVETAASKRAPGGGSLEHYLRDVSRWDLLSAEAERALARRAARGDSAALEEMINRNLRLVVYWAKRYRASVLPIQDLIQEGNIGLMRAAEKFDPRRGTRFSTYASWWIRQALARAICDRQDLIRIPVHMHQKMRTIDRMLESTGALESPDADIAAMVDELGIVSFEDWERARRLQQSVSLDRRPDQERDGIIEVEDQNAVNPVREIQRREIKENLSRLLKELPPRHRAVLKLRFGLDGEDEHTLESVGARLRISRERVRQIQTEATQRIAERAGLTKSPRLASWRREGDESSATVWLSRFRRLKARGVPAPGRKPSPARRPAAANGSGRRRRSI